MWTSGQSLCLIACAGAGKLTMIVEVMAQVMAEKLSSSLVLVFNEVGACGMRSLSCVSTQRDSHPLQPCTPSLAGSAEEPAGLVAHHRHGAAGLDIPRRLLQVLARTSKLWRKVSRVRCRPVSGSEGRVMSGFILGIIDCSAKFERKVCSPAPAATQRAQNLHPKL